MQYIVLDLEWNQALSRDAICHPGFPLVGEIIQIGAVRLLKDGTPGDTLRLIVSPKYYKKMHWNVRKLTGITTELLENGLPFPQAYEQLMTWCGHDTVFLTWGPDDIPMLHSNLRLHNIPSDDLPHSYDLQKIFYRTVSSQKQQWALSDAMQYLGITTIYPPHDALNDALNTAMLCPHLPLSTAIAHYAEPRVRVEHETDAQAYDSYEEMIRQNRTPALVCPQCGRKLHPDKWVRRSSGKRMTLATCSCGRKYILRLHWKESPENGSVLARCFLFPASEEQETAYRRALRKRRSSRTKKASASEKKQTQTNAQPV